MAETKHSISSINKGRKSKNDVLRSALGTYLKQRNYISNERSSKTDFVSQSAMDKAINTLISGEVSRPNSFSYSNAFCLNNNPSQVDQQFSRLSNFIQSLSPPIKNELQEIIPPLLCHLFIEMLRGRDFRPAFEFLKKYSNLIAPIIVDNTHKLNGNASLDGSAGQNLTNGNSQILFIQEPSPDSTNEHTVKESFKDLIQILSTMSRIQDVETNDTVKNFRSCKFEIKLSQKSLNVLKRYLAKQGHLIILQIIQVWFHIETLEAINISDDEDLNSVEKILNEFKERPKSPIPEDDCSCDYGKMLHNYGVLKECCDHFKNKDMPKEGCEICKDHEPTKDKDEKAKSKDDDEEEEEEDMLKNSVFYSLKFAEEALCNYNSPVRVLNLANTTNRLTAANIDADECHMVCGFDNSSICLWSLKNSIYRGKKPYGSSTEKYCGWSIDNCDSEEEDEEHQQQMDSIKIKTKGRRWKNIEDGYTQHDFTKCGGMYMRGHSRAITDVLFSRYNPLMYSVSRDHTMRAWKASDYTCGAIYNGHNYPIWCVAESSNGSYIATGSRDSTARLWSLDRHFPLLVYVGHTQDVDTIAFHPNGSYIATGSSDLSVRLWCVTTGKLFRVFTDCKLPIQCVKFSPDGKYLAAGGEENCIRIFDLAAGKKLTELKDLPSTVTNMSWNKYNTRIAACYTNGNFQEWTILNDSEIKKNEPGAGDSDVPSTSSSTSTTAKPTNNLNKMNLIRSSGTSCKRLVHLKYNELNVLSFVGNS